MEQNSQLQDIASWYQEAGAFSRQETIACLKSMLQTGFGMITPAAFAGLVATGYMTLKNPAYILGVIKDLDASNGTAK